MASAGMVCPMKMMCIPDGNMAYSRLGLANAFLSGNLGTTNSFGYSSYYTGDGTNSTYSSYYFPTPGLDNNNQRVRNWEENQNVRADALAENTHATRLAAAIMENQTSLIPEFYNNFVASVKNEEGYKALRTDQQRQAYLENQFRNISGGLSIESAIEQGANINFVSGFMNGVTFGIAKDKSADELKHELLGIKKPRGADTSNVVGRILGGAATGAAIGTAIGGWAFGLGTAIGAVAGGIGGALSSLWS